MAIQQKKEMTPRPYQLNAVDQILSKIHENPILVAPTGSGKTVMGRMLVSEIPGRVLWLAHRRELIRQAAKELSSVDSVGLILPDEFPNMLARIQVASTCTLIRREVPLCDVVIVDEAHHSTSDSYMSILERCRVPRIGLTATPFRLDGQGLGAAFGSIIIAAYTDELVAAGYLVAPKVYCGHTPDLRGIAIKRGDYEVGKLAARYTKETHADIVETWKKKGRGRTVAFAVSVDHSLRITEAFCAAGVRCEHLDANSKDRDEILDRLRAGETQIVSNCMILTEGVDIPELETAIIARPTASLCLHWQMIGRIMRACAGKVGAVVLDHAGNHHLHGLVTRRIEYSLDGKLAGMDEPLGLKSCPECYLMCSVSSQCCPDCGHEFTVESDESLVSGQGELTEFVDNFEFRRESWRLFEMQREAYGFRPEWAGYRYKERFGVWPLLDEHRDLIDPKNAAFDQKRAVYEGLLKTARLRGWKDGWAAHRFKTQFGMWPTGFVKYVKHKLDSEGICSIESENWEHLNNRYSS